MSDIRTDLPSVSAPNFEQRVREVLMTYLGRQGNPLDRGLTLRDLIDNGIVAIKAGYTLRPGAGSIPLNPGSAVEGIDEPDLTPPPTPTGFAVNSAISHVFIEHDAPTYTQGRGHLRTRVYGVTYTSGPLPTFDDAIEITQFTGTIHAHPSNPSTTWRLWIKWETNDGVLSASPAGGTNGLEVRTGEDVAKLLEALQGQITESQLYADLSTRIDLIDGPASIPGTVAFQVAAEAAIRNDLLAIETHQRIQGVQSAAEAALNAAIAADNERTDRIADVAVAKTELYTDLNAGLSAEAGERTLLAAQLRGGYTGNDLNAVTSGLLYQERIARANQDNSLALQITLLAAGVGEQFDWADIWYFDTSIEGWGGNGTPTAVAGFLRPAEVGSGAYVNTPAGLALDAAKYNQVRMRIRRVGTPTFAGFIWWNAEGQSWDAARRLAFDEPTYDANGIGLSTINLTWAGTIDQIRVDLSSVQTSTDYFEIDWFAVGRPAPGASTAQILEEQQARASADAAEAASRESLAVAILGQEDPTGLTIGNLTQGLIFDEREARVTGDSANASNLLLLEAEVTNLSGDVTTLNSTVTVLEQAVADATGTSAGVTQELLSTRRKLDVDAETALRAVVAGQATRTDALGEIAIARTALTTRIEEGLSAEAQQRLLLAAIVDGNTAAISSESTARTSADTALTTQLTTLQSTVTTNNTTLTAAIQTEATTRAAETGALFAKYTVKIDNNGYVSGFGLASTANNATPFSEFVVRADNFAIASPSGPGVTPAKPFIVRTTPTTINGVAVPAGVYMTDTFVQNGTITNAKIANLAVDNAKIANVSVDKLTAGSIAVGQHIQSTGYIAGTQGWRIDGNGNAELSNATVRGTVFATNGQFSGTILGGSATTYTNGLGLFSGWTSGTSDANYRWRVGSPNGARIQWTGSAIEVYNGSNQLTLTSGGIDWSNVANKPAFGIFATAPQLNQSNISTFVANSAIGTAQIADAAIGTAHISALNASVITAGTLRAGIIDVQRLVGQSFDFNTVGTHLYTVPAGWTTIVIDVRGGGGGGGGGHAARDNEGNRIVVSGGNGGNGGMFRATFTVSPGQVISITVGGGGRGGSTASITATGGGSGTPGGASSFTINGQTFVAGGGGGGDRFGNNGAHGAGGGTGGTGLGGSGGSGGRGIDGSDGQPGSASIENYQANGLVGRPEWERLMTHMNQRLGAWGAWP